MGWINRLSKATAIGFVLWIMYWAVQTMYSLIQASNLQNTGAGANLLIRAIVFLATVTP